jgi:hypothetical protein
MLCALDWRSPQLPNLSTRTTPVVRAGPKQDREIRESPDVERPVVAHARTVPRTAGQGPANQGRLTGRREDDAMTPNLTVGYMAEQINRGRLDGVAARGWLADEAATRSRATRLAPVLVILGAALVRLGEWTQGTARHAGTWADSAALPGR